MIDAGDRDAAHQVVVDRNRRSERAVAEAEHLVDLNGLTARGHLGAVPHGVTAARLTRFAAAHLDDGSCGRRGLEVFIERDDAVDFGGRDIEHIGEEGNEVAVDVARSMLHRVEGGQQTTGHRGKAAHDIFQTGCVCLTRHL